MQRLPFSVNKILEKVSEYGLPFEPLHTQANCQTVHVVGQNEIQVKMKCLCVLTLIYS